MSTRRQRKQREESELMSTVREFLPYARRTIVTGIDSDDHGVHAVLEKRMVARGEWEKHVRSFNTEPQSDVLCNMFVSAAREAFAFGIAYALCLNGSNWLDLKGGTR
jgi:hypothetical protein